MKTKHIINIGDKVNNLTVTSKFRNKHNQTCLVCKCECGTIVNCMPYNLIKSKTKSCGCLKIARAKAKAKFLAGVKVGKLLINKILSNRDKFGRRMCEVICDCGTIKQMFVSKQTKSCGCARQYSQSKDPDGVEFRRYRKICIRRNIVFELTKETFSILIKENCYYCGNSPNMNMHVGKQLKNGIDRLDNSKGYLIDNVVTCCGDCNFAKRQLSYDQFMKMIKKIYDKHLSV
jgi:hypothetical protein